MSDVCENKNDDEDMFYLVCSLDQKRSLKGFRWMNCNRCGTSGGCGPGLKEEKHHQPIFFQNNII